jgi:hypothetical protein
MLGKLRTAEEVQELRRKIRNSIPPEALMDYLKMITGEVPQRPSIAGQMVLIGLVENMFEWFIGEEPGGLFKEISSGDYFKKNTDERDKEMTDMLKRMKSDLKERRN